MIKVSVLSKDKKYIDCVNIKGHSLYDDFGKDIVCSSVSSIIITTVNGIYELNHNALNVEEVKDGMIIKTLKKEETYNTLLKNMLMLLSELSESYPENIKINISKEEIK